MNGNWVSIVTLIVCLLIFAQVTNLMEISW